MRNCYNTSITVLLLVFVGYIMHNDAFSQQDTIEPTYIIYHELGGFTGVDSYLIYDGYTDQLIKTNKTSFISKYINDEDRSKVIEFANSFLSTPFTISNGSGDYLQTLFVSSGTNSNGVYWFNPSQVSSISLANLNITSLVNEFKNLL